MPSAASESGTYSVLRDRCERLGEAGPEHDQREDEPDVVGLPDRPDRMGDDGARTLTALGAAGDEVPEAGAEVRTTEHRVGDDADHQHHRHRIGHPTGSCSSTAESTGIGSARAVRHVGLGLGPRGCSRQRRLIRRRISTSVTPTPT